MRALPALAALVVAASLGCEGRRDGAEPAASSHAAQPDRYADGKAIGAERRRWKAAWAGSKPLPSCEGLGASEAELAACRATEDARRRLREVEERDGTPAEVVEAALTLARAGSEAAELLRTRALRWLVDEHEKDQRAAAEKSRKDGGAADAGAAPAASGSAGIRIPYERGGESGHGHEERGAAPDPNPWTNLRRAHDVAGQDGARRVSGFLNIAPLAVRRDALQRVEKLARPLAQREFLRRVLHEAWLSEGDAAQRTEIERVRTSFGLATPKPSPSAR